MNIMVDINGNPFDGGAMGKKQRDKMGREMGDLIKLDEKDLMSLITKHGDDLNLHLHAFVNKKFDSDLLIKLGKKTEPIIKQMTEILMSFEYDDHEKEKLYVLCLIFIMWTRVHNLATASIKSINGEL